MRLHMQYPYGSNSWVLLKDMSSKSDIIAAIKTVFNSFHFIIDTATNRRKRNAFSKAWFWEAKFFAQCVEGYFGIKRNKYLSNACWLIMSYGSKRMGSTEYVTVFTSQNTSSWMSTVAKNKRTYSRGTNCHILQVPNILQVPRTRPTSTNRPGKVVASHRLQGISGNIKFYSLA